MPGNLPRLLYVEGKLVTNKYAGNDGVERYSTEIHLTPYNGTLTFLDKRRDEGRASGGARSAAPKREPETAGAGAPSGGFGQGADLDDEIPF